MGASGIIDTTIVLVINKLCPPAILGHEANGDESNVCATWIKVRTTGQQCGCSSFSKLINHR